MERRKVRVGVIGTGQIGKSHIKRYSEIAGAEMVAVADINLAEAQSVADKYKIPNVYQDFRKLLDRDDIEAVDVCLHNNLHMPVTVAALEAGKNVYCEKPMAGSYVDALKMHDTAKALGRKLSIQLASLFTNETKAARELIAAGEIGKIYHARSTGFRRRGRPYVDGYGTSSFVQKGIASGGALYDMGVYHIANLLYLLGDPRVERVSGKVYQETEIDARRLASSGYNVEELGLGFVKFDGGLTMDIIEAWAAHMGPFEGPSLFGSQGGVRLQPFAFYRNVGDLQLDSTVDMGAADFRWHNLRDNADAYDGPPHHWIAALQGRVDLIPTEMIALRTMLISEGIYRSSELGREVDAEEILKLSKSTAVKV